LEHSLNLIIEEEVAQDLAATTEEEVTETEMTETVEEIVQDPVQVERRENQEDLPNTVQSEEDLLPEVIQGNLLERFLIFLEERIEIDEKTLLIYIHAKLHNNLA
jgi:hypothetical protein